jgi:hypothetical protein
MPLLLASRDKFVTPNIFHRKFSVDFPTREDWSMESVDLVTPDGLVFSTDGPFCGAELVSVYSLTYSEPCLQLAPSSVKRREREWLLKSHCASWNLEIACRQSRMWLKKQNSGLTSYLPRLSRSKLRILVGLITGQCPQASAQHGSYR